MIKYNRRHDDLSDLALDIWENSPTYAVMDALADSIPLEPEMKRDLYTLLDGLYQEETGYSLL